MTTPETPQPDPDATQPAAEEIPDQDVKDISGGYRRIFSDRPPRLADTSPESSTQ